MIAGIPLQETGSGLEAAFRKTFESSSMGPWVAGEVVNKVSKNHG